MTRTTGTHTITNELIGDKDREILEILGIEHNNDVQSIHIDINTATVKRYDVASREIETIEYELTDD